MRLLRRDVRQGGFWVFVLVVFLLTHAPGLRIEGPVPRPDIWVHTVVFGLWTALCIAAEFFGRWWTGKNVLLAFLVSLAYSAFDEATQAIPILNRVCAWDDWLANAAGVSLAAVTALVVGRARGR